MEIDLKVVLGVLTEGFKGRAEICFTEILLGAS